MRACEPAVERPLLSGEAQVGARHPPPGQKLRHDTTHWTVSMGGANLDPVSLT